MPRVPAALCDTGAWLLACAAGALEAAGLAPPVVSYVASGSVAADNCCVSADGAAEGQLTVRFVRLFVVAIPSAGQVVGPAPCAGHSAVAEWEVQLWRCADVPEVPAPPTEACKALTDLWVLTTGLTCCFQHNRNPLGWLVEGRSVGPEGTCVGSALTVQTPVGAPCDCHEPALPPVEP